MSSRQVLIVDDQRDVRRVLRAGLDSLNHDIQVIDVPSGEEGLLVITHYPVDLLVADIRLPGMSGLELLHKVRERKPELKVILITGLADYEPDKDSSGIRADEVFYKPIDMSAFLGAVERYLELLEADPTVPELLETEEATEKSPGLSERLSSLRQDLKATSAVLLDDRGQILVQAGDLPEVVVAPPVFQSLMGTFSASLKVSQALGLAAPEDLLCFSGDQYDLYLSHVGQSVALLIVANGEAPVDWHHTVMQTVQPAVADFIEILSRIGVPLQPSADVLALPETAADDQPEIEPAFDLEAVFQQVSGKPLVGEDVDHYWEDALKRSDGKSPPDTGELTYDQADRLGLTPDDRKPAG